MPNIPTPRSYQQILGDMIDAFLARYGINNLATGGPILSILEAAAQSDLRSSQDLFNLLNSLGIDRATGTALDRIGADENIPRISQSQANGYVTIVDSSFSKKETKVFQGMPAPIISSTNIYVQDASGWPATGAIYIGRDTVNYEGPLTYTSITTLTGYYKITLNPSYRTQKFHDTGESVILAQGGDRNIPVGTTIATVRTSVLEPIQYTTVYDEVLADGEDTIEGVAVIAGSPGTSNNVPALALNTFTSAPFSGATVSNPLPITNAVDTETDDLYRARIKDLRQSRSKGTPLAIQTGVIGAVATDENKKIVSAKILSIPGEITTLYVDDGSGYEETYLPQASEMLIADAFGGETYFQLLYGRPVAKAQVVSENDAPYEMCTDVGAATTRGYTNKLAVKVGGVASEHSFEVGDFRNALAATAYEVVSSINARSDLLFSARTADGGTKVVLFAKSETADSIQVIDASDPDNDANDQLQFDTGRIETVWLYQNDHLLSKDGALASIASNPPALWNAISTGCTLTIAIDGTPAITYTVTDADFVAQGTGYTTVSKDNSVASWATVLNAIIPGITATTQLGTIVLTSNLGYSSRASVEITGGTLVTSNMFDIGISNGMSKDFEFDRATGQIKLLTGLSAGDTLSVGSDYPYAFIESGPFTTTTIVSDAEFWFVLDSAAEAVPHSLLSTSTLTFAADATPTYGDQATITSSTAGVFNDVAVGDWVILWDSAFAAADKGAFRVVARSGNTISYERRAGWAPGGGITLNELGVTFIRTEGKLQKCVVDFGTTPTTSPDDLASIFNTQLEGATADVYKNTVVRVSTNTPGSGGSVFLGAQNTEAAKFSFDIAGTENDQGHLADVEMSHDDNGTPAYFAMPYGYYNAFGNEFVNSASAGSLELNSLVTVLKQHPEQVGYSRHSSNHRFVATVHEIVAPTVELQSAAPAEWTEKEWINFSSPLAINWDDNLVTLIDNDTAKKRYDTPLYRRCSPYESNYDATPVIRDLDNLDDLGNPQSLAVAFGTSFDFSDFSFYMRARTKSQPGAPDTSSTMLWRSKRYGLDGERIKLGFEYPTAPDQDLEVGVNITSQAETYTKVYLPSDSERAVTLRDSMKIGVTTVAGATTTNVYYCTGLEVASAVRAAGVVTLTLTLPGPVTNHGLVAGNIFHLESNDPLFPSGNYTIAAAPPVSPTTISYNEGVGAAGPSLNIGTITMDVSLATAADCPFAATAVTANDIITVGLSTGVGAAAGTTSQYKQTARVTTKQNTYVIAESNFTVGTVTTLAWYQLQDSDAFKFYPLDTANCTIDIIATAVNALGDECPVTAVAIGDGIDHSGSVTLASWDYHNTPNYMYSLTDGVHWIRSNSVGAGPTYDYTMTFKDSIDDPNLATNADWPNEIIILAPTTAKNVSDFLNSPALGGLHASGTVALASNGRRVKIGSPTPGSAGSIQVQGGTGNALNVPVLNSAALDSASPPQSYVTVSAADCVGMGAGMYCLCENTLPASKAIATINTILNSVAVSATTARLTLGVDDFFIKKDSYATDGVSSPEIQVEKQGQLVAYTFTNRYGSKTAVTAPTEGSWMYVGAPTAGTPAISDANKGYYKVFRYATSGSMWTVWVENADAIEELARADIQFFARNSVLPGDTLIISSDAWGAQLRGTWEVASIGGATLFNSEKIIDIYLNGATLTPAGPFSALSTSYPSVQFFEGTPSSALKQVYSITPNQTDSSLMDVKFTTQYDYQQITVNYGTVLNFIDKLGFPTTVVYGTDGYKYNTGLIQEANRIVYGDERDSANYPGIAAAGATINISCPTIKRASIALVIRASVPSTELAYKVRSAVSTEIAKHGVGESIAISDIVNAASLVPGVLAVVVSSPTYSVGYDMIEVQPNEKLMVLDLVNDIQISFSGV